MKGQLITHHGLCQSKGRLAAVALDTGTSSI